MSGKRIGTEGAVMLAPEIINNGALSSLNLASNNLGLAAGWSASADHEGWFNGPNGEFKQEAPQDMAGIIALASGIKDMRALSSVNVLLMTLALKRSKPL